MEDYADRLQAFGDEDHPLSMSGLDGMLQCDWRAAMFFLEMTADHGSVAAQNGTAVGRAIELFHKGLDLPAALRQVELDSTGGSEDGRPFPDYDDAQVLKWFGAYVKDPRNDPYTLVHEDSQEAEVRFELAPHDLDPTGKPVVLVGHPDQLRKGGKGPSRVWDVKSGKGGGCQLRKDHAFQQAAYTVAANQDGRWGKVIPGGIIRLRGYFCRGNKTMQPGTHPVFFPYEYGIDDCALLLDSLRLRVAMIRRGEITPKPGVPCAYCPAGGPEECLRLYRSLC